jgi:hypothetical protein
VVACGLDGETGEAFERRLSPDHQVPGVQRDAAGICAGPRGLPRGFDALPASNVELLLRRGIVYYGGTAWTGKHELWLRTQRFEAPGLQLAYDAAVDALLVTADRADRLDAAITMMASERSYPRWWTGWAVCAGDADRVRVDRRSSGTGLGSRAARSVPTSGWSPPK